MSQFKWFNRAYDFLLMFYLVSTVLSSVVSEIFNVKKILRPWNPSQGSIKIIESDTIQYTRYGFLLVFYSNFVPKMHHFWNIQLQKCHNLENWVIGPTRSLKMSPFDRAHMTSYWRSIVTMALSRVVSEIFNAKRYRNLEIPVKGQSRSLKVVPFDSVLW